MGLCGDKVELRKIWSIKGRIRDNWDGMLKVKKLEKLGNGLKGVV